MIEFTYTAKDDDGNQISAKIEADSERSAAKLIRDQGMTPIDIVAVGDKRSLFSRNSIKSKDKVLFARQLATLVAAGLPITQSLRTVAEQTANKNMAVVVNKIISAVESGNSLASAFEQFPKVFDNVFINLVAAGEASGTLDKALERLSIQLEKDALVASKVKGALVYPVIVLVVILGVVGFMLVTVLPQVELLYDDLGQELPLITALMLGFSDILVKLWWFVLILMGASVFFARRYIETGPGRSFLDRFKTSVPLFGTLFKKMYMARFTRTGQTLMSSGVPMLEMMRITGNAVNNVHIKAALERAAGKVKGGASLSSAIKDDPNFLQLVPQMINIGEQSGSIDQMMGKAADYYESELDEQIKAISTTIEPILMVVMGGMAALLVGAILLPVYGLVGTGAV